MPSKRSLCRSWRLYVITDLKSIGDRSLNTVVQAAIAGGASVIQLRDKESDDERLVQSAVSLLGLTRPRGIPLIINDRVQVAKRSGADGLHLGQEDGSLRETRAVLGEDAIIGRSTHSQTQALAAQAEGFDYIAIGPIYQTPTKPDYAPVGLELVKFAAKNIRIPFVAIGGIDANNIAEVHKAGARTVAVVRAVMGESNPQQAAHRLTSLLK